MRAARRRRTAPPRGSARARDHPYAPCTVECQPAADPWSAFPVGLRLTGGVGAEPPGDEGRAVRGDGHAMLGGRFARRRDLPAGSEPAGRVDPARVDAIKSGPDHRGVARRVDGDRGVVGGLARQGGIPGALEHAGCGEPSGTDHRVGAIPMLPHDRGVAGRVDGDLRVIVVPAQVGNVTDRPERAARLDPARLDDVTHAVEGRPDHGHGAGAVDDELCISGGLGRR